MTPPEPAVPSGSAGPASASAPRRDKGRLAIVAPRFGASVVGGAEALSREIAMGLADRGWEVDAVTTCAVDHFSWANELEPGRSEEDGVVVHRFPTVLERTPVGRRAQDRIEAGEIPPFDEQLTWINFHFAVPELFHHLLRHRDDYQAVVFAPYLFWTTAVGMQAVPDRAVAMPCLHDEQYARLDIFRPVLSDARSVWFLSEPEHQLAHRLGAVAERHRVTGAGMRVPDRYDPDGFRSRHGIERPFLLYAGRREGGKGWDWLLRAYEEAVVAHGLDLDLVTIGVGGVAPPAAVADRVIDLGFLEERDRDDAFAAAAACVQPSLMESFSRTIMEAWLAGTPVLARSAGEVISWHCERSGAGERFSDAAELAGASRRVVAPDVRAEMGERGRRYVLDHYRWDVVLDGIEDDLAALA